MQTDESKLAISKALSSTVEIRAGHGVGAGCIIHPDGLVVTGRHVINDPSGVSLREVEVVMNPAMENEQILRASVFTLIGLWISPWFGWKMKAHILPFL